MRGFDFAPMTATAHRWRSCKAGWPGIVKPHVRPLQFRAASRRTAAGRVKASQRRRSASISFISGSSLLRRQTLGPDRVNIVAGNRGSRKKRFVCHSIIAVGMVVRHETLVAPKPMGSTGNATQWPMLQASHKAAAASIRPTSKPRNRRRSPARERKAIRRHLAQAFQRSRKSDSASMPRRSLRDHHRMYCAISNS
jgi:hypothetical protein